MKVKQLIFFGGNILLLEWSGSDMPKNILGVVKCREKIGNKISFSKFLSNFKRYILK